MHPRHSLQDHMLLLKVSTESMYGIHLLVYALEIKIGTFSLCFTVICFYASFPHIITNSFLSHQIQFYVGLSVFLIFLAFSRNICSCAEFGGTIVLMCQLTVTHYLSMIFPADCWVLNFSLLVNICDTIS